ncbi:MAG TPA: glycosyltransferase family 4 protein, partial [Thermoleophilia bacterium]|nr:glycosyltransferase family 4 protein [Thermoleophilia bacterium]
MHILYLSHYFVPENNAPAARVHAMAREWVREGHQVTVLTGAPNVPAGVVYDGYRNGLWQDEWIDGIHTIRVWTYLAPNAGTVRRTVNFVSYFVSASVAAAFVRRPDVVIATSPQFFAGWAGVPAHWAHRAPFVLEVRDLWPESITAVGAMDRGLAVRALEVMERTLYAAADHIVTVGDGYREQLMARGVPAAKIDVVTNGVETDLFYPRDPDPAVRERFGVAQDAFVVVFAGTIGMASGLDVALRAARRLRDHGRRDIVFLLVGDGAVRAEL